MNNKIKVSWTLSLVFMIMAATELWIIFWISFIVFAIMSVILIDSQNTEVEKNDYE